MEGKARIVAPPLNAELHTASLADLATVDDRVGFAPYVQALRRFLTNEETHGPLTISIEGEWGIGKSSFMKQLVEALRTNDAGKESDKHPIIVWFNAWRHDRAEELWASFALEFIRQVTRGLTRWQRYKGHAKLFYLRFRWGKGCPDVARAILWIAIGSFILAGALQGLTWINGQATKWIATIAVAAGTIGAVTKAVGWVAEKIGNPLKIDLKQHANSPDYEQRTAFIEQFHQDFAKILKAYVGSRRVFVFVDDLDRCEIPKAAELMQALNLMLSNDNDLFFLLGMDRLKVAAGVALKHSSLFPYLRASEREDATRNIPLEWYGLLFGYEFIEKFIQLPFVVPQPSEEGIRDYIRSLSNPDGQLNGPRVPPNVEERRDMFRLKVTNRDSDEILKIVERVSPALDNNLRRVKLFLNLFRLRLLTAVETGLLDEGGALTDQERVKMNLGVSLRSDQEALTLEQLGTFVALSLRWPLLLAEAANDPHIIKKLEDKHDPLGSSRWRNEPQLLEFLRANQEGGLGDVDIFVKEEESVRGWKFTLPVLIAVTGFIAMPDEKAQTVTRNTVLKASDLSGAEMYRAYCASCHGIDGKGSGPAAGALEKAPPDLTLLAKHNHGHLPDFRILRIIDGYEIRAAHGSRDMPIWGDYFRVKQRDEGIVAVREHNLVEYIRSIQQR